MAHFPQNTSKGVFLFYFVRTIILAIKLAAFLQIQPFIMRVGSSFLAGLCKRMLTFFGPSLDDIA